MDPSVAPGRMFRPLWPLELPELDSFAHSAKAELERFRKLFEFIEAWSRCRSMFDLPKLLLSRGCFPKMQLKQCDSSIGVKQARNGMKHGCLEIASG